MTSGGLWRAPLMRIEEEVVADVGGAELHWAFRSRLAGDADDEAQKWLAGRLWSALRRRGLVGVSGGRLGKRFAHYPTIDEGDEDLRAELLEACFERIFSAGRLKSYVNACADPAWNPDPMVQRNLTHFVHELQRTGDPGGTALFDGLKTAASTPERLRDGIYCEETRVLRFGTRTGALDGDGVRASFERTGALAPLIEKLGRRQSASKHAQLRGASINAALERGLAALQAEASGRMTIDELVRELRPLLPAERRREDLNDGMPDPGTPGEFDAGVLALLGDAALQAVERAPGLQARTRSNLLILLRTICDAVRGDRDPEFAVRELGWAKQSLFDRRRRLAQVLQIELPLAAGVIPGDQDSREAS